MSKVRIEIVRIKMYDSIVRTLSDVRHVLNLKKNLLSLGIFNSQGYKYTDEGGVLRINMGALVFIKEKMVNGLYMLQGSTIVGFIAISSSSDSDPNNTYLRHMRLGHMCEAGISILSQKRFVEWSKNLKVRFL